MESPYAQAYIMLYAVCFSTVVTVAQKDYNAFRPPPNLQWGPLRVVLSALMIVGIPALLFAWAYPVIYTPSSQWREWPMLQVYFYALPPYGFYQGWLLIERLVPTIRDPEVKLVPVNPTSTPRAASTLLFGRARRVTP